MIVLLMPMLASDTTVKIMEVSTSAGLTPMEVPTSGGLPPMEVPTSGGLPPMEVPTSGGLPPMEVPTSGGLPPMTQMLWCLSYWAPLEQRSGLPRGVRTAWSLCPKWKPSITRLNSSLCVINTLLCPITHFKLRQVDRVVIYSLTSHLFTSNV